MVDPAQVFLDLDADSMADALGEVANRLAERAGVPERAVLEGLLDRERLGTTSVGGGFAIPHCKLVGIDTIRLGLARFNGGVEFDGANGDPIRFLFVVLSPPDQPAAHLQVLSQIARVLKRRELRDDLLQASTAGEVVDAIQRFAETEGL